MSNSVYYWQTDDEKTFRIGGREFHLIKRGRELAEQTSSLSRWLATHGALALNHLSQANMGDGKGDSADQIAFLGRALGSVMEPDPLIDLGATMLVCEREFVEEHFDLGWVVNAAEIIWKYQPGIQFVVNRFASSFFGRLRGASSESAESASSTISEQPTDGATETSTKPSKRTG